MEILGILAVMSIVSCGQTRVLTSSRQARLSLAEPMPYYFHNGIDGHQGTYSYGYDVVDPATGNSQFRTEERYPNGTVVGSYGYVDPWGRPQRYKYIADERGYRVIRDPPYKPAIPPPLPSYPGTQDSSVTWTRPKRPNKKKNNYNIYRPSHNFVGSPSSYAED